MLVKITQNLIKTSKPSNAEECGLARGIKALVNKNVKVEVDGEFACFEVGSFADENYDSASVPLSNVAKKFISNFDGNDDPDSGKIRKPKQVQPCEINVNIPKRFLKKSLQ